MKLDWQPLLSLFEAHDSFLLTSHCRADCDALGSELALAAILEQRGKQVRIVNGDEVPRHIRFIDPDQKIESLPEVADREELNECDMLVVLDTSAWGQLGPMSQVVRDFPGTRAIVDHHVSEDDFQASVFKDPTAEATGRLILDLAEAWEAELTPRIAQVLFLAIATDTGWFRFASVTQTTFLALAKLAAAGASPPQSFSALYEQHTLARLKLRSRILRNIEPHCDGRLMSSFVTQQDFATTDAETADTEDVINTLLTVAGSQVAVLFVELKNIIKVSLRSRTTFDVRAVAERFGGGGHKAAAGIGYKGSLSEAQTVILQALKEKLDAEKRQ